MLSERIVLYAPDLLHKFTEGLEKEDALPIINKRCISCNEVVAGLVFDYRCFIDRDPSAIFSIILNPLTRVTFGIHNNLFHRDERSHHFSASAHYTYVCKKCADNIAGKVVAHIPEIEGRYLTGEIIDEPDYDVNAKWRDRKGCWITIEEFSSTSSIHNRSRFLNYQTDLKRFNEIITSVGGPDLKNIVSKK